MKKFDWDNYNERMNKMEMKIERLWEMCEKILMIYMKGGKNDKNN